jgi:hypothetical protein
MKSVLNTWFYDSHEWNMQATQKFVMELDRK